jgi:hypothetical protein
MTTDERLAMYRDTRERGTASLQKIQLEQREKYDGQLHRLILTAKALGILREVSERSRELRRESDRDRLDAWIEALTDVVVRKAE